MTKDFYTKAYFWYFIGIFLLIMSECSILFSILIMIAILGMIKSFLDDY